MKVFLDTNVWLSATIFSGLCEELLLQCAEHDWLLTSTLVQIEAHEVLQRQFAHAPNACALFDASWQVAQLIADVDTPSDDNDKRLVAAAALAGADLLVTGDKRVLGWDQVKSAAGTMRIVSARTAWGVLMGAGVAH
jgi:putative PIN family toxin of toxin-antitoxin system